MLGVPMPQRLAHSADLSNSTGFRLLLSQEPLPPYELDPMVDNLVRKRIGEVIAKAAESSVFQRLAPKRRSGRR